MNCPICRGRVAAGDIDAHYLRHHANEATTDPARHRRAVRLAVSFERSHRPPQWEGMHR